MKTMNELEQTIKDLRKKYQEMKVNLVREGEPPGTTNGEGCWVLPIDKKSYGIWNDDMSKDEFFYVRLVNHPIYEGWHNQRYWGSLIKARTNGIKRPYALRDDQNDDDLVADAVAVSLLYEAENNEEE